MTLVVAVTSAKSIWLLTDRRLSFQGREPKDDARKLLFLESVDGGVAMLGYAGLGCTANGTEPGDWMAQVLVGRKNPLEYCLRLLGDALREQLPRHLDTLRGGRAAAHYLLIPVFESGEPRLYSIELRHRHQAAETEIWLRRHTTRRGGTPRVMVGGSGAAHLLRDRPRIRALISTVRAHDEGKISPTTAALELARVNSDIARLEPTVGQRSIVSWRFVKGGGAHRFFDGLREDSAAGFVVIPNVASGMDMNALVVDLPFEMPVGLSERVRQALEWFMNQARAAQAKVPKIPDDKSLR